MLQLESRLPSPPNLDSGSPPAFAGVGRNDGERNIAARRVLRTTTLNSVKASYGRKLRSTRLLSSAWVSG